MSATSQSLEFLEQLPGVVHQRLYSQPSTVLAVFRRMLPHLAKTIVMALLYAARPLSSADLDNWIRPEARGERDQAVSVLESLHIIELSTSQSRSIALDPAFKKSLRQALTGRGSHRSFGVPSVSHDKAKVTVETLDKFARKKWEAILYYMVGSTGAGVSTESSLTSGTKLLLNLGEFVEHKGGRTMITRGGFTFLLQEVNSQVWSLLIVYLNSAGRRKMDAVECLSFLFMLGSLELGQDYDVSNLTISQKSMLDDLNDYGLVYRSSATSSRFFPTRLATTLNSDALALGSEGANSISDAIRPSAANTGSKGYIIIETNYRLYAYTSSLLQIAVLNLFCKLHARFPNMVSGKLTKESVQRAIGHGITSDQIISYLASHAHPQMQKCTPVLPPTVVDQIRLWQLEGDRMKADPGFLLKEFATVADFEDTCRYADSLGVLVWRSDAKRMLFVSRIEQVGLYLNKKIKEAKEAKDAKEARKSHG